MAIQLQLNFKNELGRNFRITVDDAKENLTDAEVKAAMDTILSKNIFNTSGGNLTAIVGAELVTTTAKGFAVS